MDVPNFFFSSNGFTSLLSTEVLNSSISFIVKFVNKIISLPISEYIDVYGHGFKPIPDKWDVIAPYKYHLVLENSVIKDYWSEKLADSFLGFSFPIYHGCPNIYDYFSKDSLSVIDINNIDQAVKILQNIIEGNIYDNSMQAIDISRNQVLNQYNIFNLMSELATNNSLKHQNIILNTNMFFKDSLVKKITRFILSKFTH